MTGNHLLRYAENRRTLYYIFWYIYEHAHHTSIPHFGIYMGLLVSILDLGVYIYIYEHFHWENIQFRA
jgi:hypothetical protein